MFSGLSPSIVPQKMAQAMNSFPLVAAPLFILMGNLLGAAKLTDRIVRFATSIVGCVARRLRAREHPVEHDLRGHGRLGGRRRRGNRRRRSPRDEEGRLPAGDGRRDQRRGGDHRADHSAQPADGDLRRHRRRIHRPPLSRRLRPRRADGPVADGHGGDHRAAPRLAAPCLRRPLRSVARIQGGGLGAARAGDPARRHVQRPLHAHRSRRGRRRVCAVPRLCRLSHAAA